MVYPAAVYVVLYELVPAQYSSDCSVVHGTSSRVIGGHEEQVAMRNSF